MYPLVWNRASCPLTLGGNKASCPLNIFPWICLARVSLATHWNCRSPGHLKDHWICQTYNCQNRYSFYFETAHSLSPFYGDGLVANMLELCIQKSRQIIEELFSFLWILLQVLALQSNELYFIVKMLDLEFTRRQTKSKIASTKLEYDFLYNNLNIMVGLEMSS